MYGLCAILGFVGAAHPAPICLHNQRSIDRTVDIAKQANQTDNESTMHYQPALKLRTYVVRKHKLSRRVCTVTRLLTDPQLLTFPDPG